MTLHEVLERAAEMDKQLRWDLSSRCDHDLRSLPRTATGGVPGPPYYCPVCYTAFSPVSFRPWNPPAPPE